MTVAYVERLKRGLTQATVSDLTVTRIPILTIREIEHGQRVPTPEDLTALAMLYGYSNPSDLLREAVLMPAARASEAANA